MLSEKQHLLARLQRAQGALPPGHPALAPSLSTLSLSTLAHTTGSREDGNGNGVRLWEREWTGGSGLNEDNSSDEEE